MLSDDDIGELMQIEQEVDELRFHWERAKDIKDSDEDLFEVERSILQRKFLTLNKRYRELSGDSCPNAIDFDDFDDF